MMELTLSPNFAVSNNAQALVRKSNNNALTFAPPSDADSAFKIQVDSVRHKHNNDFVISLNETA